MAPSGTSLVFPLAPSNTPVPLCCLTPPGTLLSTSWHPLGPDTQTSSPACHPLIPSSSSDTCPHLLTVVLCLFPFLLPLTQPPLSLPTYPPSPSSPSHLPITILSLPVSLLYS
ncbi:hypothetical protein E2C01_078955 [Portunus trituberculatus]|uniref:Uncharacterized protein n=1 Tax=Portunus trituberculatus TaxID=210409 RepID=A0A5B7IRI0_PORTR|nr:hypothetical protein [Portunus trituberculatus]